MDKILIIGFLLIILCLIIRELACKGETNLGNCLKTDRDALTSKMVSKVLTIGFHHGEGLIVVNGKELIMKIKQELLFQLIFLSHILPRKHMRMGPL